MHRYAKRRLYRHPARGIVEPAAGDQPKRHAIKTEFAIERSAQADEHRNTARADCEGTIAISMNCRIISAAEHTKIRMYIYFGECGIAEDGRESLQTALNRCVDNRHWSKPVQLTRQDGTFERKTRNSRDDRKCMAIFGAEPAILAFDQIAAAYRRHEAGLKARPGRRLVND